MSELLKTGYAFITTKIFFNRARLIRRPVYIRGKRSIAGGKNLQQVMDVDLIFLEKKKLYLLERIVNLVI